MKEVALLAQVDPGYKIELADGGFRITYTFPAGIMLYTHENFTSFRAVTHAQHNPLRMAMNDLKDASMKFKRKIDGA